MTAALKSRCVVWRLAMGAALALFASVTRADDLSEGDALYQQHCGVCHGRRGEGAEGPTLAVASLPRASTPELLSNIILRGIPNTGMPRTRLDRTQLQQVMAFVASLAEIPAEPTRGNVQQGRKLYFDADCAQCHALHGKGGAMGPDLSKIGLSRGAAHLRASLTDPDNDVPKSFQLMRSDVNIAENFLYVRLVTKDRQEFSGVRVNEDTFSIQLREADNSIHSFYKSELAEFVKEKNKSPMPSYRDTYNKEELDDLVAFLASLRGER